MPARGLANTLKISKRWFRIEKWRRRKGAVSGNARNSANRKSTRPYANIGALLPLTLHQDARRPLKWGGDVNPASHPTLRISCLAGVSTSPPSALSRLDYVEEESELRLAINGPSSPFGYQLPLDECSALVMVESNLETSGDDPN